MPGAENRIVTFEVDPQTKKVKCLRCGKDLTEAVKILGEDHALFGMHVYAHLMEDLRPYNMDLIQNLANMLGYFSKSTRWGK